MPRKVDADLEERYQQLTRMVLVIYYRIVNSELEDWEKAEKFETQNIMYDEWIIDIPKIIDLISIYGADNSEILRQLFNQVMKIEKYEADVRDCIQQISEKLLNQIVQDFKSIKNRDTMDDIITDQAIAQKMKMLTLLLDSCITINQLLKYFPKF